MSTPKLAFVAMPSGQPQPDPNAQQPQGAPQPGAPMPQDQGGQPPQAMPPGADQGQPPPDQGQPPPDQGQPQEQGQQGPDMQELLGAMQQMMTQAVQQGIQASGMGGDKGEGKDKPKPDGAAEGKLKKMEQTFKEVQDGFKQMQKTVQEHEQTINNQAMALKKIIDLLEQMGITPENAAAQAQAGEQPQPGQEEQPPQGPAGGALGGTTAPGGDQFSPPLPQGPLSPGAAVAMGNRNLTRTPGVASAGTKAAGVSVLGILKLSQELRGAGAT